MNSNNIFCISTSLNIIISLISLPHKNSTSITIIEWIKFSANVKSGRIEKTIAGVKTKTGYTISQTVGLAMKTAESEFDAAQTESVNERFQLENMLFFFSYPLKK